MAVSELCPVCGGKASKTKCVVRAGKVAICEDCDSWYRVPRPSLSELKNIYTKEYYDPWGMSDNEESVKSTKYSTFSPILDHLEKLYSGKTCGKVKILDVGAATGLLLETAVKRGWDPYALELNPYSAGVLRKKFGADHVFEGELVDYPGGGELFDIITMTDVIEHVVDIDATLKAVGGLLKDGGLLCLTTPRIDSLSRALLGKQWLHFKEEHIQYFSGQAIADLLSNSGFTQIQISAHNKYLTMTYVHQQLQAFRHVLITPIVSLIHSMLPKSLRVYPIKFRCGEMLVISRLVRSKK